MNHEAIIHVNGIVQGVGFRPYVYKLAKQFALNGFVLNLGDAGVKIVLDGPRKIITNFIEQLQTNPPSISRIDTLDVEWKESQDKYDDFEISKSSETKTQDSEPVIPPDIAMCDECIRDLFNESSRWYNYPFTSCAACGPRYATITDLPYDRTNTTMNDFPLCDNCNTGYTDPLDRRYHAQTTACEKCGPRYTLQNADGKIRSVSEPIAGAAAVLKAGKILAVQGISGTHLVTITSDAEPIRNLRRKKSRFQRPFAIMLRDRKSLEENFTITEPELDLLTSWRRPIVLVRKRDSSKNNSDVLSVIRQDVLDEIAPGLDTVGVMLPYAPTHHLLFRHLPDEVALVMTSANPTGIPMYIQPEAITSSLSKIADYYLLHNRRIYQRADDSVIKFITYSNPLFIRRSRGFTPEPIRLIGIEKSLSIIGVGPEEKNMATILKAGQLYPTQYIGDTNNIENIAFIENAYMHLSHLIGAKSFDAIACDLHPEFLSTVHAEDLSRRSRIPLFRVQHHHAHLASILADHKLPYNTNIICITADGFGYAPDGSGWGGEILVGNSATYQNKGGLKAYTYPGGDLSAKFGVRPLVGIMKESFTIEDMLAQGSGKPVSSSARLTDSTLRMLLGSIDKSVNTIVTSSAGRYLDAVASILGICDSNTYDGEAPMKLEAVSRKNEIRIEPAFTRVNDRRLIDLAAYIRSIIDLKQEGVPVSDIAYASQWNLGKSLADLATDIADQEDIKYIGFSGGVALNRIITAAVVSTVEERGFSPLIHSRVPPGDGGVSVGQVMVAVAALQSESN